MTCNHFDIAAQRRQRILDFLAINPGAQMDKIVLWLAAFGDDGNASNTIRTMTEWGEVRYTGKAYHREYFALKPITRDAAESRAISLQNTALANSRRREEVRLSKLRSGLPRIVHKEGSQKLKGPRGGQGAVRTPVSINCFQHYF